ncbi:MAG: PIG-L family deacetylase [Ferruginibacter sp.]
MNRILVQALLRSFVLLVCWGTFWTTANSQTLTQPPVKVLVVVAHPDDETAMAATIYKITHEQGGVVDQAVITNGEGGYRYSLLAEPYYQLKLTDESVGRTHLPRIRKQELINAGKIIGIRNHYFFDQKDARYGLDAREPLDTTWNVRWVETRLTELMTENGYDYVFCLLPDSTTHAHHKAATILALRSASTLKKKPVVLGAYTSNKTDTTTRNYIPPAGYPITRSSSSSPVFRIDRTTPFGFNNRLNYKIIVNWEIAEHKSQGTMQTFMNQGDYEHFRMFDANPDGSDKSSLQFFQKLNNQTPSF